VGQKHGVAKSEETGQADKDESHDDHKACQGALVSA
jgi:hypothetical protein